MHYELQLIKKITVCTSLVLLLLGQNISFVYAQQASDSGTVTVSSTQDLSATPTLPSTDNPFADESTVTTQTVTAQTLLSQSLLNNQSQFSASLQQPPVVGHLAKHSYRKDETVSVTVGNQDPSQLQVVLLNAHGDSVDPNAIVETQVGAQTLVTIDPKQFLFTPGKYTLKITDSNGTTTTQDFTWGVLALNTDKSLYTPGQTADISLAVLDDAGATVCDASVTLTITSPSGVVSTLTTANNSIVINPQCLSHEVTTTPDYEAHFQINEVGNYSMDLSATTQNGTNSIVETLHAVTNVPFDVQRVSATRLYPSNAYPMIFHITAQQDFSGNIVETAPANFTITPYASTSAQSYTTATLVLPTPDTKSLFGVDSLSLGMPFTGNHAMDQGFGVALTDPVEKAYYGEFGLVGHDGLDFAMNSGIPVLATDDGIVVLAGDSAYGTTIVIDHPWGKSYYGHLSKVEVSVGDHVTRGEEIGLSGATGHVTGPHLHFGIKPLHFDVNNGFYGKIDPTPYLLSFAQNTNVLGASTTNVTTSENVISWHVTLKKGQSISLGYNYQSPQQSPAFYDLGPLQFIDASNTQVFEEARQWELAVDANSTAGPSNCSTSANDTGDTGAGTVSWGTVGSSVGACANAGTTAAASITSSTTSHFLKITGFGFAIPSTAKVIGVQFSIKKSGTAAQGGNVLDSHVYLIKAAATQTTGTDQASATSWPTTAAATTYGSASTISWGGTWLASDINNSGFGIAIGAKSSNTKSQTATITGFVTATITYDQAPNAPTSQSPSNSSTTATDVVDLQMTATDPESDNVQYVISLYTGGTCSGSPTTYDQGTSQSGWIGSTTTCSVSGDCYASGTQGDLNVTLNPNTLYSWTVAARDPLGSNALGSSTSCISFTSGKAIPTLSQLLRHGEWFNAGVVQPFTF